MMNLKVIGAGAAGNKAAINLVNKGFNINDVILVNSTARDIPTDWNGVTVIFGSSADNLGGCGKERDIGKKLILTDMSNEKISFDNFADPNTNATIIVASTEGGSGSAVAPILAKYVKEVLGIPVIMCLFFGFNTDVRGMQNSIEICQELTDDYGVVAISNAKFMENANNNVKKAEMLANDEFASIVKIISGSSIIPGSQNIDDTDLFKLIATPGYMLVESTSIAKTKNLEQYNKIVANSIDTSMLMDTSEKGAKRIGIIYDVPEEMYDVLDFSANKIQNAYGIPYEMFTHIQNTDNPGVVSWIVTGMPLPVKEVQEIYSNYIEASASVKKSKDSFFDSIGSLKGNQEDGMFNLLSNKSTTSKGKSSFLEDYGIVSTTAKSPVTTNSNSNSKVSTVVQTPVTKAASGDRKIVKND